LYLTGLFKLPHPNLIRIHGMKTLLCGALSLLLSSRSSILLRVTRGFKEDGLLEEERFSKLL
jgi:hypothetical protein